VSHVRVGLRFQVSHSNLDTLLLLHFVFQGTFDLIRAVFCDCSIVDRQVLQTLPSVAVSKKARNFEFPVASAEYNVLDELDLSRAESS
jgi:hypothetical protein